VLGSFKYDRLRTVQYIKIAETWKIRIDSFR
jgi:hypothetical protein